MSPDIQLTFMSLLLSQIVLLFLLLSLSSSLSPSLSSTLLFCLQPVRLSYKQEPDAAIGCDVSKVCFDLRFSLYLFLLLTVDLFEEPGHRGHIARILQAIVTLTNEKNSPFFSHPHPSCEPTFVRKENTWTHLPATTCVPTTSALPGLWQRPLAWLPTGFLTEAWLLPRSWRGCEDMSQTLSLLHWLPPRPDENEVFTLTIMAFQDQLTSAPSIPLPPRWLSPAP